MNLTNLLIKSFCLCPLICSFLTLQIYFIRFSMNISLWSFLHWWAQTRITLQRTAYLYALHWSASVWSLWTFRFMVGSSGLEPPTSRLSGARSNHLSYEPMLVFGASRLLSTRQSFRTWWRWWESNPWPPACRAGALPAELHPHFLNEVLLSFLTVTQNRTTSEKYSLCIVHYSRRLFWFLPISNTSSQRLGRYFSCSP